MSRWLVVRRLLLASACVLGLVLACFGPALRPDRQLAYRDFSDYYYPLYQKVQQEWTAGRLPVWSAGENGGAPLLADPTAAVLYPGKLIYAALPYPVAAKAYVVAHLLLAFATMVVLLRHWEVSAVGSFLGGLAYAFGGPVLTQYSNVVFLVGAAWMPLGFRFADGWIRLGRTRAIAGLAIVLALQVLGGDPEAAYLTAFAAAAYAVGRWVAGEPRARFGRIAGASAVLAVAYAILLAVEVGKPPITTGIVSLTAWLIFSGFVAVRWWSNRGRSGFEGRWLGLVGACGLALALSGPQLVPSLEFLGQSTRADSSSPIDLYAQSIHPARLVEWIWPNAFGPTFGRNQNWLTALPPTNDHTVWMNSLYFGGLAALLAACALGGRVSRVGRGWMIGVALVGVLGGFGDFGSPIFWARAMPGGSARFGALEPAEPELPRPDGRLRDGDGGVYWFVSSALPGFRSFRYPGKLFIPAAVGLSALVGIGFDALLDRRRRGVVVLTWFFLAAGLIKLAITWLWPGWILEFFEGRAELARSAFGPFDPPGALVALRGTLVHGSIVLAAFLILARLARRRQGWAGVFALLVVSADLAVANRGQIGIVAQSAYEGEPRTLEAIRQSEQESPETGPFRVYRLDNWAPAAWSQVGSPDRLEEIVRWERDTLRSKYEQPLGVESTFAYGSAELANLASFFRPFPITLDPATARSLKLPIDRRVNYYPRRGFDLWNTRYFIVPTRLAWNSGARSFAALLPDAESIYPRPFVGPDAKPRRDDWAATEDVQVLRNRAAFPRAWVVHRVIPVGPTALLTEDSRRALMTNLLYQDDELWRIAGREPDDLRKVARVEATTDQLLGLAGARDASEPVRVREGRDPSRVELEVNLETPGLVILADVLYPGWTLEIDGQPTEILRTNRLMRGAVVPAGIHRLVYTYRPISVPIGLGCALAGFLVWVALLIRGDRDKSGGDRATGLAQIGTIS